MAETFVENQVCSACGADVREEALFCYNCGGAVASGINVAKTEQNKSFTKSSTLKKISKEKENGIQLKKNEVIEKQPARETFVAETAAKPIGKPNLQDAKLQSAAAIRGKSKIVQPKRIEVIWEEHESTPNVWFILTAVALTVLAIVILFLAIRMK